MAAARAARPPARRHLVDERRADDDPAARRDEPPVGRAERVHSMTPPSCAVPGTHTRSGATDGWPAAARRHLVARRRRRRRPARCSSEGTAGRRGFGGARQEEGEAEAAARARELARVDLVESALRQRPHLLGQRAVQPRRPAAEQRQVPPRPPAPRERPGGGSPPPPPPPPPSPAPPPPKLASKSYPFGRCAHEVVELEAEPPRQWATTAARRSPLATNSSWRSTCERTVGRRARDRSFHSLG